MYRGALLPYLHITLPQTTIWQGMALWDSVFI